MKSGWRFVVAALALWAWGSAAHAAIACQLNPAPSAVATTYNTGYPLANVTQGTFTIRCRRTAAGDAASVNWTVDPNNEGANAVGTQNRGRTGANRINYELYTDSSCGTVWAIGTNLTGTMALPLPLGTWYSTTGNFWVCVPAGQATVAAGTYTDTVQLVTNTGATANLGISIAVPGTCSISTLPSNVDITYTAFGAVQNGNSPFQTTCTNRLPYSLDLDSYVGLVAGLQYTLSLGTVTLTAYTGSGITSVGTGAATQFYVNVNIPAGQAGSCSGGCSGSKPHTLTITY